MTVAATFIGLYINYGTKLTINQQPINYVINYSLFILHFHSLLPNSEVYSPTVHIVDCLLRCVLCTVLKVYYQLSLGLLVNIKLVVIFCGSVM